FVKRRFTKSNARLCRLSQLEKRVAHAGIGLVGRIILGIRYRYLEMLDRVLVVVQRGIGHAQVVVHRAARVVGRIGRRLSISMTSLVRVFQLDESIAYLVI